MSSLHGYTLHGLSLLSSRLLPAAPLPAGCPVDCELLFVNEAEYQAHVPSEPSETLLEIYEDADSGDSAGPVLRKSQPDAMLLRTGEAGYELLFDDRTRVWISTGASRIVVGHPGDEVGAEAGAAMMHLLGQGIGFALRLRGSVALHASCIEIEGHAVALAGPSTAGKSTTAAAFALRGTPLITENVTALDTTARTPQVFSGSTRLLLFDDSAHALFGAAASSFPRVATVAEKRVVEQGAVGAQSLPLGVVLVLDRATEPLREPVVRPLDRREALLELLHNSYGNAFFTPVMRARDFEQLSGVASAVPILSLRAGRDLHALPALCDSIERVVRELLARRE